MPAARGSFSSTITLLDQPQRIIAEGSFGTIVYRAHETNSGSTRGGPMLAAKCIQLNLLPTGKLEEAARREVDILKLVSHPAILKTHSFFVEQRRIWIVSEYLANGDLFDHLGARGGAPLAERDCRKLMRSLCDCVRYLHDEMHIVHRDIKLENLMLRDAEDLGSVVLIDFGFARKLPTTTTALRTDCGTRQYASPEMLLGRAYGKGVDVWALGVSLFMLIAGYHPFELHNGGGAASQLFSNICGGQVQFAVDEQAERTWAQLGGGTAGGTSVKDFIQGALRVDPVHRLRIDQLCAHAWLKHS